MYIVPYTYRGSKSPVGNHVYHTIDLLVQGGTALWEEEEGDVPTLLASNDIFIEDLDPVGQTTYAKVDSQKTHMASMYRWTELPLGDKDTLSWRRFNYITEGTVAWLPAPSGPFGPVLEHIVTSERLKASRDRTIGKSHGGS